MANATMQNLSDRWLNFFKGTQPAAPPATFYVALLTANATTNTGTSLAEVSGSSYARQPITASTGWSAISQNADTIHDQISNAAAITFPVVTTTGYTVVGVALYDAVSAGNLLMTQSVTSQAVAVGNSYQLAIGALLVEF
jgi:hypothetical protein